MQSDRMRTDAISESIIQVLYCRAVSGGDMYRIGYSLFDNKCSVHYSLFVHVLYSNVLIIGLSQDIYYTYSVLNYSYIRNGSTTMTLHNNIGLVSWIQIWHPFSLILITMHRAPGT